jgi:hypothetical protein
MGEGINCRQPDCKDPAAFRYTWPGKDESYICAIHAVQLEKVASAIGLHQQFIPLTTGDYLRLGAKVSSTPS